MSLPAASFIPPPAAIYDSDDASTNNNNDDTSNQDGCDNDGSGGKGSDGKEMEDAPPPHLGRREEQQADWVAHVLSSSGNRSIMVSMLRWLSVLLLPSGVEGGGGEEARKITGRSEEDEYQG